jgi:hypothetical protein
MNHEDTSPDCHCGPRIYRLCTECGGERCPLCGLTGFSEAPRTDWDTDTDGPFLLLHHDGPEDETDINRELCIMEALKNMKEEA